MGVFVTQKKEARWMDLGPAFLALYPALSGKNDLEGSLLQLIRVCVGFNRRRLRVRLGEQLC